MSFGGKSLECSGTLRHHYFLRQFYGRLVALHGVMVRPFKFWHMFLSLFGFIFSNPPSAPFILAGHRSVQHGFHILA